MDRLICGDVGFGKTEVAMRAAFIAIQSGKQVAILVPTTLLAQQHTETFKDRFVEWPVNIDFISRFKTKKGAESSHRENDHRKP
jgi:transcription-repair coupling factor (superfamily II helicase)